MGIEREGIVCMRSGWDVGDEGIWKDVGGNLMGIFVANPGEMDVA